MSRPPSTARSLAPLTILVGGTASFLLLAVLVRHEVTLGLDARLSTLLSAPSAPWWVRHAVSDLTGLGGRTLLTVLGLLVAGYLAATGQRALALFVLAAVAGGLLLGPVLKSLFLRPRPDLAGTFEGVRSTSFPSAHALQAAAVWGLLGPLLARAQRSLRARAFVLSATVLLILLVGLTRVWLGVHHPTDVLAGWSAGAAWAALCWLAAGPLLGGAENDGKWLGDLDSNQD